MTHLQNLETHGLAGNNFKQLPNIPDFFIKYYPGHTPIYREN